MKNPSSNLIIRAISISALPLPKNTNYRRDIKKFNEWLKEHNHLLTQDSLEKYFSHIEQLGMKPATIQRYKSSLRKSVKELFGNQLTQIQNEQINLFFRAIKTTTFKDEKGITANKILSIDELKELINNSGTKTSLLIQALFETASRVSELCNIRISNCKRSRDGVEIRIIGKGSKSRIVYLSYNLYEAIRKTYKGKIFLFEVNQKPLNRITAFTLIRRAGIKIGRQDIHPHMLRHTFASLNINRLGLPKVSKYLGHSNLNVTTAFYLHGKASLDEILLNTKEILEG